MKHSLSLIKVILVLAVLAALLGVSSQPARADFTCTTTASGLWTDPIWSCAGSPGATNIVINAAHTVTLNDDITIRNLTINGTLQDDATGNTLTITGNMVNAGTFTAGSGTVVFGGTNVQTLTGSVAFNNLTVAVPSILDLGTDGAGLATVGATLDNNGIIRAADSASPYGFSLVGRLNGADLSIVADAGGNFGTIIIDRIDSSHPYGTGTEGGVGIRTGIYWDINIPGSETGTATLVLPVIIPTLDPPVTASDLRACRYVGPGTLWDCAGVGTGTNTVERTLVSNFSEWSVGISVGPTAIELARANASPASRSQALVVFGLLGLTIAGLAAFTLRKAR